MIVMSAKVSGIPLDILEETAGEAHVEG